MREYGLMFRLPSLQSFVTGVFILSAGALAYWLHDRLLVMIVGTLSWWLGGMAFAWVGMTVMYYWLTVAQIKHEAWHRKYDSIEPLREWPEVEYPKYMQSIILGRDIDPKPPVPPEQFNRDMYSFRAIGIEAWQMYIVADKITNGEKHFVTREFIPHWRGFTRGEFRKLTERMVKKNFARWETPDEHRDSCQLTESGRDFLEDVLVYVTCPPSYVKCEKPA